MLIRLWCRCRGRVVLLLDLPRETSQQLCLDQITARRLFVLLLLLLFLLVLALALLCFVCCLGNGGGRRGRWWRSRIDLTSCRTRRNHLPSFNVSLSLNRWHRFLTLRFSIRNSGFSCVCLSHLIRLLVLPLLVLPHSTCLVRPRHSFRLVSVLVSVLVSLLSLRACLRHSVCILVLVCGLVSLRSFSFCLVSLRVSLRVSLLVSLRVCLSFCPLRVCLSCCLVSLLVCWRRDSGSLSPLLTRSVSRAHSGRPFRTVNLSVSDVGRCGFRCVARLAFCSALQRHTRCHSTIRHHGLPLVRCPLVTVFALHCLPLGLVRRHS
mmetsp:Transcript_23963/g.56927  ORF Transcript_23963/g.56927 Transcript_23963/m.56927 type:complete len:321 (+) Transcript_23963:109-1071(+)